MTAGTGASRGVLGRRQALGLLTMGVAAAAAGCTPGHAPRLEGVGPITVATPPDFSRGAQRQQALDRWDASHPGQDLEEQVELPTAADGQHTQLVATLQAGAGAYDVVGLDVTWTDEFARDGYLLPLTWEQRHLEPERFLPAAERTGRRPETFRPDPLYAVPLHTNVGVLYHRTDLGFPKPPRTWAELEEQARAYRESGYDGFIGQLDRYEGLVVNLAEVVWGHGGELVDGGRVRTGEDGAADGLAFLLRGLREGWIPRESLGYDEEAGRLRFQEGRAGLLRNWPYAHAYFDQPDSPVKGRFGVTTLPGPNVLGGANLAVTTTCAHRRTALRFIRYLSDEDAQRSSFAGGGYPPSVQAAYDNLQDAALQPLVRAIRAASANARQRPRTPFYQQVSCVIQRHVHEALRELHSPRDTMDQLADALGEALQGR